MNTYNIMENNINLNKNIYNIEKEVKCLEDLILKIEENYNILNIKVSNLEIDNKNLKEENRILKIKINNLKEENRILKEENRILKIKINNLEEENKILKIRVNKLENKDMIKKICEAISDIINEDNLETKISEYSSELKELKRNRNDILHYIRRNDTKDIKNQKILILIDKLKKINKEIKDEINLKFYYEIDSENEIELIEKIIEHYENNKILINSSNISKKDIDRINYWWK